MRRRIAAILVLVLAVALGSVGAVRAASPTPYSGMEMVATGKPFAAYLAALEAAVTANGPGIVARACADCGAKSIGVTIPGNRILMVFAPRYAVRMLAASVPAGIEAPLRLYVTEQPDGTAKLTYRLPSHVFGAYADPELAELGEELDQVFAAIVAAAGS